MKCKALLCIAWAHLVYKVVSQSDLHFNISESAPVGSVIGYVWDQKYDHENKFYTIFPNEQSQADKLIAVDEKTGEVITIRPLDHEQETELVVLCIPNDGSPSRKVIVTVLDENDNAPTFAVGSVALEVPEYAQIGAEFALPYADDIDSPPNDIQKYRIIAGNVNNAFRLKEKKIDDKIYIDLVVNGPLDREYRERYSLLLEAVDGGSPPRTSNMSVHVHILDANDNAPVFDQVKYNVKIPGNVSLGYHVITVKAQDADEGENARISYQLQNAAFKGTIYFRIDSETGIVTTTSSPLPSDHVFTMVVTAFDHGIPQSLEAIAYLTISVIEANPLHNVLHIDWLTEDNRPYLMENLTIGFVVARVSVSDVPDQSQLSLSSTAALCLKQTDLSQVYLMLICGELDREKESEYKILFTMTSYDGKVIFEHPVHVEVGDVNDNAPEWPEAPYRFVFNRSDDAGQQASRRLIAVDKDYGKNALLHYVLEGTELFRIHPENGVLFSNSPINCSVGNHIRFRVVASDAGHPQHSTSADVLVDIVDNDAEPPLFEKALYEVTVPEDVDVGSCIVQVNAKDKSCGGRDDGLVYSIHHHSHPEFRINPQTGEICVAKALDFERQQRFQLTVFASSQDQKSATALVNINVQDLNDNAPIFSPLHYFVTISSNDPVNASLPLLQVHATDKDNGEFEGLLYSLVDSYDKTFKVDAHSGLLYYIKKAPTSMIEKKHIELTVTVSDVGKLQSNDSAVIHVNLGNTNDCPAFSNKIYKFKVSEDVLPGIVIGELSAKGATLINIQKVNEEDPEYFYLDGGKLSVSRDISESDIYFLTAQAISTSGCTSFAQVQVEVDDVNNHVPQFNTDVLKISIPENFPIHTNFFSVQAQDKDRNENGRITYELMSSRPHCPVIIQPITGQTILAAPLDYENVQEYQLVIRAQDQGIPALSSTVNVTLKVLDVNDNAPEFKQSLYKAEVPENAQLMTTVLKVLASDKDSGNNGKVKYRLVKTSYSEFEINAVTGEIYLNQELDRERQSDYSFVVVASDSGSPELETNASVHIKVLDINDNSPNCSTIQPFYIKRGEDRHIIGVIDAKDADNGANGTVTYRIQRHNEYFDVKTSGHISIKKKLPLNLESYGFFVIAEDGGPTARSVVCQVRVNIEKRTKTITVLGPVDSLIKLDPACGVGCQLARINVTNVERWELEESTVSQYFDVNDGILKLVKKIEDESLFLTPRQLVINMFEKENKQKQLTFTVKKWLRVMNNEHTNTIKVSEQLVPGTKVVSGGGALEHCYYNLDQNWSQTFGLNPSTGDVYLTSYFNYSDVNSYTIRLTRHNILIPDLVESTLIVEVENENLHSPKFSSVYYNFSVIEDVPIGTRVGQLSAFDEDDGNNKTLTFKMVGDNSYFTVDESNGEIYTKTALDYGKQEKHQLVVEVLDNPPDFRNKRSSKCVVVVDVIDTNNHVPLFLSDSNITIVLDPLVNSIPVHYFVAEDSDSGDFGRVRYSIIDGNKPEYFSLDSVTGELSMIHRPDGVIKLTVRAADQDLVTPQHTDQLFTVNVKQNEVQWFFFSKSVNEITVTDAEKGATLIDFGKKIKTNSLYFKLLPQTEKSFLIDQSTGVVKLNSDNLQQPKYHLTAYVLDKISNKSDTTSVVVTVPEVQYGPKMSDVSCGEISVIENRNFDSLTRVVATINGKPSKEIHYSIVGGSGGDRFEINQASGVISSKPLDRESQDEYILVVSASDKHTPQRVDVCTIKVHVLDENDNAPEFKDNATVIFTITEKDAPGAIIGRVEATDNDIGPGGKVWYKLSNDESGMLDIIPSTGDIIFARNLPFTSFGWEATVIAEDLGLSKTLHSSKTITIKWERKSIKVTDIDEVQFLRHNYTATVIEGLPKGTFVIQVESTDIFMPINKVTYKIISGNNDAAFTVDELGVLKTAQVLDSEINSVYILKLVAIGNFRTLPECLVTVRVINVNDNSPIFSPPLIQHIEEDLPSGSLVMSVRARDADPESILEYALSPPTEFFHLNRFTGELLLLKPLDFETQAVHVLNVHAYDGEHTVFTEFTVRVLDVNDNAPKFSTDLFEFSAGATVLQGATIGRISAMDADSEEFGRLHYSLIEAQNFVALDGDTGLVTLMKPLRSDQNVFLTVQARDFGTPPLMSLSTIRLSGATRTNKKAPRFKKTEFKFMVAEDFPLYLSFGQVDVTTGVNALLEYSIISFDGSSPPFKILPNGKLYLVGPLDYTAKQTYNFEISVKNAFEPENSRNTVVSKANLFITVTDANNNGPVVDASSRNINVTLKENFEKGQFIAKIQAADADAGNNGKLSYFILASSVPSMLKLDENTGDVTFDQWYDNSFTELRSRRDITEEIIVLISDNGAKKRWTNTKMTVTLLFNDWSGSAPFFPVPYYKAFLPEATHEGATVVNVRPVNRLGLYDNSWRYDIIHNDEIFTINSTDGTVYLSGKLDFELHNEYEFIVTVSDSMGRSDRISVYVSVLGIDENAPMFTMPSYEFYVPWSASVGQEIGIVEATDADKGVHSKVVYTLQDKHLKSIGIDGASGTLMLLEPLSRYSNHSVEEITVIASSSPVQFSKVPVTLHFMDSTDVIYTIQNNVPHLNRLIIGIGTSLFVLFCVLLVFMLYKIMQRRGQLQRPKRHIYSVAKGNVATMANVNKMSPNYFKTVKSISSTAHTTISQPCSIKSYEHEEINVKPESDYVRSCDEAMLRSQIDSGIDPDSSSIVSGVTDYLNHVTARTSITFSSTNPIVNQILNANIQDDVSANEAPISSIQPTVGLARPLSIRKQLHFNFPELPSINRIISENEKDDNILL